MWTGRERHCHWPHGERLFKEMNMYMNENHLSRHLNYLVSFYQRLDSNNSLIFHSSRETVIHFSRNSFVVVTVCVYWAHMCQCLNKFSKHILTFAQFYRRHTEAQRDCHFLKVAQLAGGRAGLQTTAWSFRNHYVKKPSPPETPTFTVAWGSSSISRQVSPVFMFYYCYNKLLQTQWLKTTRLVSTALEVGSLKWVHKAVFLLEALEEMLFPCLFYFLKAAYKNFSSHDALLQPQTRDMAPFLSDSVSLCLCPHTNFSL